MPTTKQIIIYSVLAITIFAFGRYSAPDRVEIRTETVTVEIEKKDKSKDQQVDQNKKTTEYEVTKPDGTKIKKKTTEIDKKTDTKVTEKTERQTDTKTTEVKITEKSRSVNISVIAGPNFTDLKQPIVFGGHISRQFLGPISIGVWGLSSGQGGMSLGLQF